MTFLEPFLKRNIPFVGLFGRIFILDLQLVLVVSPHLQDLHPPLHRNSLLGRKGVPAETLIPLVLFSAGNRLLIFEVFQFRGLAYFEGVVFSE